MPWGLLFLPLLAGYLFIHLCVRMYYRAKALENYRLLFEAAAAGAVFFLIARIVVIALRPLCPGIEEWRKVFPQPYLGTAMMSIPVALAAGWTYNYLYGVDWEDLRQSWRESRCRDLKARLRDRHDTNRSLALREAFEKEADSLIRLLYAAATTNSPIAVTLTSRKWYAGAVARLPNLEVNDKYFHLLPFLSGHRDQDSLQVDLTSIVDYRPVYEKSKMDSFVVIIPLADVREARLYDLHLPMESFRRRQTSGTGGAGAPASSPPADA